MKMKNPFSVLDFSAIDNIARLAYQDVGVLEPQQNVLDTFMSQNT